MADNVSKKEGKHVSLNTYLFFMYCIMALTLYVPHIAYYFNFFHFSKEEDDEVTDEDNTSSDDGYPRDKKVCFMCKECFPTFSGLIQHQVLCKNTLKCPKCHVLQEQTISLSKTLCATLNCVMEMGHLDAHTVPKFFMIIIWLEITNIGVEINEYVIYAILQPVVLKQ